MVAIVQSIENLAVVGMETVWAGCNGLDAFERLVYEAAAAPDLEQAREDGVPLAGESLLNKSAMAALLDAGINISTSRLRIAAFVAGAQPLSLSWPWAVFVEDLSGENNTLAAVLEKAGTILTAGAADFVLFAARAGLVKTPEGMPLASAAGFGFDREVHGWRIGEGAGAVVFQRRTQALNDNRRIYAVLRSMAAAPGKPEVDPVDVLPVAPTLDDVRGSCRLALERAQVTSDQIGYLGAFACGVDALDGIEIAGTVQAYRLAGQNLSTAMGSAQANTGYLGAAAGLAGLVQAALCTYHRFLPGAPAWSAPKLPALWRSAPFYVPGESRPWFEPSDGPGRLAALSLLGLNGSFAHLILSEEVEQPVRSNHVLEQSDFSLFPLVAHDLNALMQELNDLQKALAFSTDLRGLAAECYLNAADNPEAPFGLAIVGHNHEEVAREIELARKSIPSAAEKGVEWQTPLGSYFTPQPAGSLGGVALVYPGAFNTYPGVGKDLFRLFPELYQRFAAVTRDMGNVMHERLVYPRSLAAISKEEMAAREAALLADPIAMLISGTALTILYTHILLEKFDVRASAAFGYSLGENSMMYATGVWGQGDQASARLARSDAFRVRLAGPQQAIREYWGMPVQNQAEGEVLWSNYLVMSTPEKVQHALENAPHVYLTHINTPRQVVIGGDPQECKQVLAALRCSSLKAPFDYALHCAPMRSEYGALADLHNWPVERTPYLRMYTAADYAPVAFDQQTLAHKLAHMLTSPLDFPRLVQRVYVDGARIFIEAGAGSNCARWIDESLKGSPHLAISMDRRGTDELTTLVRTLARLHCHRVPLNLAALYQPASERVTP